MTSSVYIYEMAWRQLLIKPKRVAKFCLSRFDAEVLFSWPFSFAQRTLWRMCDLGREQGIIIAWWDGTVSWLTECLIVSPVRYLLTGCTLSFARSSALGSSVLPRCVWLAVLNHPIICHSNTSKKGKDKVIPLQARCGPEGGYTSMTAALEVGEWSAARPGRTLPPGKTR